MNSFFGPVAFNRLCEGFLLGTFILDEKFYENMLWVSI
jgi:hypothetical protein